MVELSRNSLTTSMPGLLASAQEDIKKKGCSWQMNQNIFLGNNTTRPNPSSGANMNNFHLAQWSNYESAQHICKCHYSTTKARIFLHKHK